MTKIIKTAPVRKADYVNYLKKAAEFHEVMLECLSRGKWNAVGLNAIHAGISSADQDNIFCIFFRFRTGRVRSGRSLSRWAPNLICVWLPFESQSNSKSICRHGQQGFLQTENLPVNILPANVPSIKCAFTDRDSKVSLLFFMDLSKMSMWTLFFYGFYFLPFKHRFCTKLQEIFEWIGNQCIYGVTRRQG